MNKKIILFSSCGIFLSIPTLALTSCGQQSQFIPVVTMNINSEKYYVGYGSNNVIYDLNKKELDTKEPITKDLVKFYLTGILPFLTIGDRLVNLSHYSENKSSQNLIYENNLVFDKTDTWSNNSPNIFFKEFMYASSNILNQGRKNQIKLYLSEVTTEGLNNNYLPYTKTTPVVNNKIIVDKLEKPIELKPEQKIYIYDATNGYKLADNQQGVYYTNFGYLENNLPTFNLKLTYRYYYPENQDKFKPYITNVNVVKKYVNENKAWNNEVEPTTSQFDIKFNVQVTLRPKFEFSSYIIKSGDQLPSDDEVKKLVDLTETTSNNKTYYEATLDFDEKGNSSKFSNWLYEAKFLPTNNITISKDTTPLLAILDESKNNNDMNNFNNSKILNDAMASITSTPSINTLDDYSKFIKNIKQFKSFLTTKIV